MRTLKDIGEIGLPFIVFIGVIITIILILAMLESFNWNDGYCSCGGKWEYEQAVGHNYSTGYIYKCNRCGKRLEVSSMKEGIGTVE